MGIVHDAIKNGVGDGGFADHVMPPRDRQLGGNQCGFSAIALFEDFEEVKSLLIGQRMRAPIVENEELDPRKFVDEPWEATIKTRKCQVLKEPGHTDVENRVVEASSLSTDRACEPGFPRAGLAGNNQVLMCLEPSK